MPTNLPHEAKDKWAEVEATRNPREKIKRMMANMAGYWISIDYTSGYLGLAPASHLTDFMAPLFLGIIHYGYAFSGDKKYLNEFNRILQEFLSEQRFPDS